MSVPTPTPVPTPEPQPQPQPQPRDQQAFEVWRQDDNGNHFLVSVHDDSVSAETALRAWESGVQHKQLYYVKERSGRTM